MGSAAKFTVALGVCGLLLGATAVGADQERREAARSTSPASREERGPSPVATAVVAETPAAMPPGLSKDAPDTAPSIGVAGGKAKGRSSGASPAATPEPSMLLLMGAGLAGLYQLRRRR
jgi:hypothetical protein